MVVVGEIVVVGCAGSEVVGADCVSGCSVVAEAAVVTGTESTSGSLLSVTAGCSVTTGDAFEQPIHKQHPVMITARRRDISA